MICQICLKFESLFTSFHQFRGREVGFVASFQVRQGKIYRYRLTQVRRNPNSVSCRVFLCPTFFGVFFSLSFCLIETLTISLCFWFKFVTNGFEDFVRVNFLCYIFLLFTVVSLQLFHYRANKWHRQKKSRFFCFSIEEKAIKRKWCKTAGSILLLAER